MAPRQRDRRDLSELAREFRAARAAAGLRQDELWDLVGFNQNKMSRIENDQGLPTVAEAEALLDVYKVHGRKRAQILKLVKDAETEHVDTRLILQGGAHHFQERLRALTAKSRLVRSFVPNAVLGYLQTPAYARVVMSQRMAPKDIERSVQKRMEQNQLTLDDSGRTWRMIQTEGGLRWNVGGTAVMAEQVEALVAATDNPNITLGFIPWRTPVDLLPLHSFHIYDRRAVIVGTWSGTAFVRSEPGIKQYEDLFDRLERFGVFGDEACAELRRIADEYRLLERGT